MEDECHCSHLPFVFCQFAEYFILIFCHLANSDFYLAGIVNKIRPLKCTYLHFMQLKSILGYIASQPKAKKSLFIHLAISDTHLPNSQIIVKYGIKRRHAFAMQLQFPSICFLLAGGVFQTSLHHLADFRFSYGRGCQFKSRPMKPTPTYANKK